MREVVCDQRQHGVRGCHGVVCGGENGHVGEDGDGDSAGEEEEAEEVVGGGMHSGLQVWDGDVF